MSVAKRHSLPADDHLNEVDAENDAGQRRRKGGIGKVVKSPAPDLSGVGAFAGLYFRVIVQIPRPLTFWAAWKAASQFGS